MLTIIPPLSGAFREIDGVKPRTHRGNAFCGAGALYLTNSFSLLDNTHKWAELNRLTDADDNVQHGWNTDEFPYLCMAYRFDPDCFLFLNTLVLFVAHF